MTNLLEPAEIFELECVGEFGEIFSVYLVASVGATFTDVWLAVPSLKKTNPGIFDVSRIAQISTLAEVRTLPNAAHDDNH